MNKEATPPASRRAPRVLAGLLLAVGLGGGGYYLAHRGTESTDDAQVEGHIVNLSARVPGQVVKVWVKDNQPVQAGDLLVELDPADLEARQQAAQADLKAAEASHEAAQVQLVLTERNVDANLRQARGTVTQAGSGVQASASGVAQARADVAAAEARERLAQTELLRARTLMARGAAAQAELDAKQSAYDQAEANLRQSQARLQNATATTTGSAGAVTVAQGRLVAAETGPQQVAAARAQLSLMAARVQQAQAALRQAELNLSYTKLRAPVRGVVSRKTVEEGALVSPDRPLLALVPLDDVWIVANFKEDQLAEMRPGQAAQVRLDTYGRREFAGAVDGIAGATGARFSLLPPDNASGNYVKVAQRVPVLIRLSAAPPVPLRPGMSAYVTVRTR